MLNWVGFKIQENKIRDVGIENSFCIICKWLRWTSAVDVFETEGRDCGT